MTGHGFIDIHTHGGAGYSYDDAGEDEILRSLSLHREHGTGASLLSLVSAPVDQLVRRLEELRPLVDRQPEILGVHLEGPFLAPSRCGAHDPQWLVTPTPEVVDQLLTAGEGVLRQITVAPELPGAADAIARLTEAGIVVAVGHTEADYDAAAAAFDCGAGLLTHAFNAMPGLGHRDPGPVGAALARGHVAIEVIADGVHVHPVLLKTLFSAAAHRVVLVSDSMAATGLGDGRYRIGGLEVEVRNGVPLLVGSQTLAGSTLTLDRAVEVAVIAGVARSAAVEAATSTPARVLGLDSP